MLNKYSDLITSCTICHDQCVYACPIFTVERKTTVYPSRKSQIAHCLLTGEVEWDNESAELFYHCCGCRQCMVACVYVRGPKDPVPVFHAARHDAIKKGIILDYVQEKIDLLERTNSLYGDIKPVLGELRNNGYSSKDSGFVYLADDETLALNPEAPKATLELLKRSSVSPIISEETNAGYDVMAIGLFEKAEVYARKMAEYLNSLNAEKIVVSNPKVFYALTDWYETMGIRINAEVELETTFFHDLFLAEHETLVSRPNVVPNFTMLDSTGTYQDGSFMARYIMDYRNPRRLVKPLFRHYEELRTNRKNAAPAAPAFYPLGISDETLKGIAQVRIVEIDDIKADYVITSDPLSYKALKDYWSGGEVYSVPEILLMNYIENDTEGIY